MIIKNLFYIALASLLLLVLTIFSLKWYTDHGESIKLPDYIGYEISAAIHDAKKNDFRVQILDSIFMVGKEGGIILSQNPAPGSGVKENRKIYVTVTKFSADKVTVRKLPIMYGKSFEMKRRELKEGFEIESAVVGYQYDPGAPDHILAVIYKNDTIISSKKRADNIEIEKGATLKMVLSKSSGGSLQIPELLCNRFAEAAFLLNTLKVSIQTEIDPDVDDEETSFIWKQIPPGNSNVRTGDTITLFLSRERPDICPEEF